MEISNESTVYEEIPDYVERSCQALHPDWIILPRIPTVEQFNSGLGGWAIAIYTLATIALMVIGAEYGWLVYHFIKNVPSTRLKSTIWVNSLFLIAGIMAVSSVVVPQASQFVWGFYQIYLTMVMYQFVSLTMDWYGGGSEMVSLIGHQNPINLRVPPACCCFCCIPKDTPLSERKVLALRGCVYQMPYVQTAMIFVTFLLLLSGTTRTGNYSPDDPNLYIQLIIQISFFTGMWALFSLVGITLQYEKLSEHHYRKKALLLKLMMGLTNLQTLVIDALVNYNVIHCVNEEISGFAMGCVIKSSIVLVESLVFGSITLRLYQKHDDVSDYGHL